MLRIKASHHTDKNSKKALEPLAARGCINVMYTSRSCELS